MAFHIKDGYYGKTSLDGLNLLALSYFKGNIWTGNTKVSIASFVDERADNKLASTERGMGGGNIPPQAIFVLVSALGWPSKILIIIL